MALISVIMPCYNVADYIDRAMTSIVTQTIGVKEIEIICVDDASTDDTWEHLLRWEEQYPEQMILIRLETNARQGNARNIGLSYASSPWIAFVDSDDWLEKDYFELLYAPNRTAEEEYDIIACKYYRDPSRERLFSRTGRRVGKIGVSSLILLKREKTRS